MTYEMQNDAPTPSRETVLPRVFLREPGWHLSVKIGSDKSYCYQMTPGEDHYHRLLDGEVMVHRGDERLCLPCAERRGLVTFLPRVLRDQMAGVEVEASGDATEYELKG